MVVVPKVRHVVWLGEEDIFNRGAAEDAENRMNQSSRLPQAGGFRKMRKMKCVHHVNDVP